MVTTKRIVLYVMRQGECMMVKQMIVKQKNRKGFTLIELLVVVLIIGILAAIALPQYRKMVEKSKLTEVLSILKVFDDATNRFLLVRGGTDFGSGYIPSYDYMDTELSGGEWDQYHYTYTTKNFSYMLYCSSNSCMFNATRNSKDYYITRVINIVGNGNTIGGYYSCYTENTDMGRYICNYLKHQRDWTVFDQKHQ